MFIKQALWYIDSLHNIIGSATDSFQQLARLNSTSGEREQVKRISSTSSDSSGIILLLLARVIYNNSREGGHPNPPTRIATIRA